LNKRGQLFIGVHNKALSVVAMGIRNPDRSPVLRKIRLDVTRKMRKTCEPRITRMSRIGERRLPAWLFRLRTPKMLHDVLTHGSLKLAGVLVGPNHFVIAT
jgi:hypothetical protein